MSKSLEHEFRATSRVMLPIFIALFVLAIAACFSIKLLDMNALPGFLQGIGVAMVILFVVALITAGVGVIVLTVIRFYRSFLSDEGYLNMTLPVSVYTHISSRLIVSVAWYALTAIAIALCIIAMILSTSDWISFFGVISDALYAISKEGMTGHLILIGFESLLGCVVSCAYLSLLLYAALAVGHSFNRHKKGLSILFAFLFYLVVQILGTVAVFALTRYDWSSLGASFDLESLKAFEGVMGVGILCICMLCAVFYLITHFFLSKKLNLE